MRVGVFMPDTSRFLFGLVVEHLARQSDMEVLMLRPDPARDGRAPLNPEACDVLVFVPTPGAARGVEDVFACASWRGVELVDDGRHAVEWTIRANDRPIGPVTPETLVDAVRQAAAGGTR